MFVARQKRTPANPENAHRTKPKVRRAAESSPRLPLDGPPVGDYRHAGATRKNNPPAKIAAEGVVPAIPKVQYAYNPHLPPVLLFDAAGRADTVETRLSAAAKADGPTQRVASRGRRYSRSAIRL